MRGQAPGKLIEMVIEIGLKLAGSEGEGFWLELFEELKERGLRTTNMLERVAKELKERAKAAGAFPSEQLLIRLAGFILMDINEE